MVDDRARDVIGADAFDAPARNRRRPEVDHHVCDEDPHPRPSLTAVADALPVDVLAERLR